MDAPLSLVQAFRAASLHKRQERTGGGDFQRACARHLFGADCVGASVEVVSGAVSAGGASTPGGAWGASMPP